jgi:hypothetical protein
MDTFDKSKIDTQTSQSALELFDSLEPVDIDFMIGHWQGEGYPTNHPLDGLLEAYHWHGKYFESSEDVHPLVFSNLRGKPTRINPRSMGSVLALVDRVRIPKSKTVGKIFQLMMPLLSTSKSRARLRMTEYRGKTSATMIYDQLPINDVFRKLDDNSVLGVMDLKGMKDPFFFKLKRENNV